MDKIKDVSKINIRDCFDSDCVFVHKLAKENMGFYVEKYWKEWNKKKFVSNLNKKNLRIIEFDKKNIGYYNTEIIQNALYLHDVQLIKPFQGKGIGKYLMEIIERKAKENKVKQIKLSVFNKNPAKNFYQKLGYRTIKKDDVLSVMEKNI